MIDLRKTIALLRRAAEEIDDPQLVLFCEELDEHADELELELERPCAT